jgi:hypothetical protein
MTALVIPSKVPSLVRLLASENDGEALGAARALGRVLSNEGMSFHDLADRLTHAPPYASEAPSVARNRYGWSGMSNPQQAAFLAKALAGDVLSPWEREFANSVRRLLLSGVSLSAKQASICERMFARWMEGSQ